MTLSPLLALAFLSGIPALAYQVLWTREAGLLLGSQIEAISAVLAAFFGGLAVGSRLLGAGADRAASPLRLYGMLEIGAGLLALLATALMAALGRPGLAVLPDSARVAATVLAVLAPTFLLGGTLPALLRAAASRSRAVSRAAGALVAANTAGSVLGVGFAALLAPAIGLRPALGLAAAGAIAVGAVALSLARVGPGAAALAPAPPRAPRGSSVPARVLAAAALAGAATLAFEALAARSAALRLGSTLYAWASVLALFLVGLAAGNALAARRAEASRLPARTLGWVELAAALCLALCAAPLAPGVDLPALGLTPTALARVVPSVLLPAVAMGAAFPFFVRLALSDRAGRGASPSAAGARHPLEAGEGGDVGASFGTVSAWNTAGGIAGALLAPFVLLPGLGLERAILACAAATGALGVVLLAGGSAPAKGRRLRVALAAAALAVAGWLALGRSAGASGPARLIFVAHGSQASAAVVRAAGRRDLLVDGDFEASTGGGARETEELLAALALRLHPAPKRLLEVGLGSGITLGAAARFPLETLVCVEIADSVLRAAPLFAPENRGVADGADPRVRILHGDGRLHLARRAGEYDVVLANTVQPWSVGATGLYSREYFERLAMALRPGGLAAQWLPAERLGERALAAILRTFFAVFPEGALYWGADNVILVGSGTALAELPPAAPAAEAAELLRRLGLDAADSLAARRLARAAELREVVGPGEILTDGRPRLELWTARERARAGAPSGELDLLLRVARAGAPGRKDAGALVLWIEARAARAAGDGPRAERLERLAETAGFAPARRARLERTLAQGRAALAQRRLAEAEAAFRSVSEESSELAAARFGLAVVALERGDEGSGRAELERLVRAHPDFAEGWNVLGAVAARAGDRVTARRAFARALEADPAFPEAIANAGLAAAAEGDLAMARAMWARLRALSPRGPAPEEVALRAALERSGS